MQHPRVIKLVSPTALRLRRFLRDKPQVGASILSTLVRLDHWIDVIQASGSTVVSWRRLAASATASDPVGQIAEDLAGPATGIERQLLIKALEEALFCCVGFDTDLAPTQITARVKRFLNRQSKAGFIQQFLSFYFFNYVWFHTGDLFSSHALPSNPFRDEMEEISRICQTTVVSAYEDVGSPPLNESAAQRLIWEIEQRLRGT